MADEKRQAEQNLIAAIKAGDQQALGNIYLTNRDSFVNWARKHYRIQDDDILDVYQDAIIVLNKKIMREESLDLTCSIQTFLFSIGKNLLKKKGMNNNKWSLKEDSYEIIPDIGDLGVIKIIELSEQQQQLFDAIDQLGDKCQNILKMFYYQRYSMESIKTEMGYKHVDVARSQKLRCMKSLRAIILQSKEDIR